MPALQASFRCLWLLGVVLVVGVWSATSLQIALRRCKGEPCACHLLLLGQPPGHLLRPPSSCTRHRQLLAAVRAALSVALLVAAVPPCRYVAIYLAKSALTPTTNAIIKALRPRNRLLPAPFSTQPSGRDGIGIVVEMWLAG